MWSRVYLRLEKGPSIPDKTQRVCLQHQTDVYWTKTKRAVISSRVLYEGVRGWDPAGARIWPLVTLKGPPWATCGSKVTMFWAYRRSVRARRRHGDRVWGLGLCPQCLTPEEEEMGGGRSWQGLSSTYGSTPCRPVYTQPPWRGLVRPWHQPVRRRPQGSLFVFVGVIFFFIHPRKVCVWHKQGDCWEHSELGCWWCMGCVPIVKYLEIIFIPRCYLSRISAPGSGKIDL